MLRRALGPVLLVLLGGASGACGFAALGLALYAAAQPLAAASLFAAFGFAVGLLCALLAPLRQKLPAQRQAELSGDALASMVRATLAQASAERGARSGSAADRRPADVAAAALALAAVPAAVAVAAPAPAPAAASARRQFASSAFGA